MSDLSVREATKRATARMSHSDVEIPRDRDSSVPRPPGPSTTALINAFRRGPAVLELFTNVAREHPQIAHTRLLGEHLYLLNSPDVIVDVMQKHGRNTMKGRGLQGAKALLGNGLLTSEGDAHMRQRRLVQPAFHHDRIRLYADQMADLSVAHEATWVNGAEVDMVTDMSALTLAIVGRTLFGSDLTGDASDVGDALTTVLEGMGSRLMLGPAAMRIPSPSRRRAVLAAAQLDTMVQRIIDNHRGGGNADDMLAILISATEDGTGMTDEQLRDESMTLVLAGHETTAMTLSWGWMLLAQNPLAREWMTEELDAVLNGRTPVLDDLDAMPRTRAVVAEILRMYPAAWVIGRRLLDDVEIGDVRIPRGAICLASEWVMQRDQRWWDQPLSFRPDRWLTPAGTFDESAPGQPRGAFFPFGFGNRRCIGESFAWTEAMLILGTLAQRWSPELVMDGAIEPMPAVTLRPSPGMAMRLVARAKPQ